MSSRRALVGRVLGAFGLLCVAVTLDSACALFAPGSTTLETDSCSFEGETTACGACIKTSCEDDLNLCCTDSGCSPGLTYVDGCAAANGNSTSCTLLANGAEIGGDATFVALGACVTAHCPACNTSSPVVGFDAGSPRGPGLSCGAVNGTCFCDQEEFASPSTISSCNAAQFPNGICCADPNYPTASSSSCTCSPFTCTVFSGNSCICSAVYVASSAMSPSVCAGQSCCASTSDGSCSCGEPCDGVGVPVDTCLPANTGCGATQKQVTACL